MSASMAEVLAEHVPTAASGMFNFPNGGGNARYCSCGERFDVLFTELDDDEDNTTQRLNAKLAAHQSEQLAAAGYGKLEPCTKPHVEPAREYGHDWPPNCSGNDYECCASGSCEVCRR